MVTPLTIPRRHQSGFAKIGGLPDESFGELLTALSEVPSTISFDSLSSAVAASTDTIAVSDVEEMVPAVLFLHQIQEILEMSPSKAVERVSAGMEEISQERLRLPSKQHDIFRDRLLQLLDLKLLSVIARAGSLSVETEHSLAETRILTDIRPIFEPKNPRAAPTGAVIIHTLKINYRDNNQLKDFFVTLDANDVRELKEQLERASAKAESLRLVLDAAQVSYIDTE